MFKIYFIRRPSDRPNEPLFDHLTASCQGKYPNEGPVTNANALMLIINNPVNFVDGLGDLDKIPPVRSPIAKKQ